MITDSNSHLGSIYDREGYEFWKRNREIPDRVIERYFSVMEGVDRSIVVAFPQGPHLNDNDCIAHFARRFSDRVAGFSLIDPRERAIEQIDRARGEWGAKGVHLAPIYQNFKPDDEAYFPMYAHLEKHRLPVIWFQGSSFEAPDGPLEWANPVLLDKVARSFPELKMMIAHFGSPWFTEVVALIKKRPNVFTEISALSNRTWALYNALINAVQYGVEEKILFGSEFPMQTPQQNREALQEVVALSERANLPRITPAVVQGILERDTFALLGIS